VEPKKFDSMISDLSHEIRSPLNSIINMAELALKEDPSPRVRDYLKNIEKSAGRLLGLLDDIMRLSLPGDGDSTEAPEPLVDVLEQVLDTVEPFIQTGAVDVGLRIEADVQKCFYVPGARLRRVLIHILDLAARHIPSGKMELIFGCGQGQLIDCRLEIFFKDPDFSPGNDFWGDRRLAICRNLIGEGEFLVDLLEDHMVFSFSMGAEAINHVKALEAIPAAVMVNSDGFSAELLRARLQIEGVSVKTVASLYGAAEFFSEALKTSAENVICFLNWKDVREQKDLGVRFLRSAAGQEKMPVIIVGIPAMEMMSLAHSEGLDKDPFVSLLLKPSGGENLIEQIARFQAGFVPQSAEPQHYADATKAPIAGLKVLVVEDDRINQKILLEILKKRQVMPVVASTGEIALRALEKRKFDAIFMDINLPDMNGFELTSKLRKSGLNGKTPVIALTASTTNRQKCFDAGMNDFLSKPYSEEGIFDSLTKVLNYK